MGDYYGSERKGKGKGSFGGYNYGTSTTTRKPSSSSSSRREVQHEDFEERDVWEVDTNCDSNFNGSPSSYSSSSSSSSAWHYSGGATSTPSIAIPPPPPPPARAIARADVGPTWSNNNYGGDEEEEEEDMVPPHEWLARKLAGSQISSSSVCEGIGRTLKGRDLSQVRNAILTKTGFLE